MNKLNIIIGNAPINNGNRGCVALSVTTMFLLDKILKEHGVEYKFYLPDSGYEEGKIYAYRILDKKLEYHAISYPFDLSLKRIVKGILRHEENAHNIVTFKNADYIFDIGQGDSFADIYGKGRFDMIDRIHKLAHKLNKPYCLLPQTIGPFKDKTIKKQANKSIRDSSLVMARDKQSFDYVLKNVPEQRHINEYTDVAFFLPYCKRVFDKDFIHVGLNISALLWNGGYTCDNQFGLKVDYQRLVHSIIDYFLSLENIRVHLIPHVVLSEHNVENDYEVSCKLYYEYNNHNLILSELFLGSIEAKNYISGMHFFMGARMHSTIAAFSSGVPVVPMAYSRKFNGLFIDTLNYPHMVDMKIDSEEKILQTIREAFEQRDVLKETIVNRMSTSVADYGEKIEEALCEFMNLK